MSIATKARRTVTMNLTGCTRHVLLVGSWAIKMPALWSWKLFLCGLLANMQERQFSGTNRHLCPVLFGVPGGWLLVMRRAAPLSDHEWSEVDSMWEAFVNQEDMDLPVERKSDSVGMLDGRVVAVDYGT